MKKILITATLFAAALAVALASPALGQAEAEAASDGAGFLYGRVETRGGNSYTGVLRWGTQELFWDDLFNGGKAELPYADHLPRDRRRDERVGLFEWIVRLVVDDDWEPSRQFWVRFGDIDRIRVRRHDAEVVVKGGTVFRIEAGGGNDTSDPVHVYDASLGEVKVDWDQIESIQFLPTPPGARLPGRRLAGRASTRAGAFEGWVQWDAEESISVDLLDGESEDGDMSIEMGRIRSIARDGRRGSRVTLTDGRTFDLSGTNDVDSSIRGIFIEDPRYGRVEIPWDRFEELELVPAAGSGAAYDSFPAGKPLRGTVIARGGQRHRGRIVFDIDEGYDFEILHGKLDGVELSIPFRRVAAIAPEGRRGSTVTLRSGEELFLEDSQDVGEDNAGVLVFAREGAEPVYLPWDEVTRIDFE